MISKDDLLKNKDDLSSFAKQMESEDIQILIVWLNEKDDNTACRKSPAKPGFFLINAVKLNRVMRDAGTLKVTSRSS